VLFRANQDIPYNTICNGDRAGCGYTTDYDSAQRAIKLRDDWNKSAFAEKSVRFLKSKKYCAKNAELCTQMILIPSFHYRFEFDLGPDGLELMKRLAKKQEDKKWTNVQPSAGGLANTCWLKAAHTGEVHGAGR
jgi:hypothetical protein